jgi:undecaprenyl diphosphate synthase
VNHILLVLDDTDLLSDMAGMEKLRHFTKWCDSLNIPIISVYISVTQDRTDRRLFEKAYSHLREEITGMLSKEKASIVIYADKSEREPSYTRFTAEGDNKKKIYISLGFTGRRELTKAVQEIAKKVQRGKIDPEEIDEKQIESELIFKSEPDLVIRSGATSLTDFLIWQSVYTEFYFTDVNWVKIRKIDLLRAIRDFKMRERRFGR